MRVVISLASLTPSHTLFLLFCLSPRPGAHSGLNQIKAQTSSMGKFEDSPAVLISPTLEVSSHPPSAPLGSRGDVEEGKKRRVHLSMLLSHQASWLLLREKLEPGKESRWQLPLPSDTFRVLPAPLCRAEGRRRKPTCPWLTESYRPLGLDFCACAMCGGGEVADSGPPLTPLLFKAEHHTGPGTPEWVQAAGSLSHRSPGGH